MPKYETIAHKLSEITTLVELETVLGKNQANLFKILTTNYTYPDQTVLHTFVKMNQAEFLIAALTHLPSTRRVEALESRLEHKTDYYHTENEQHQFVRQQRCFKSNVLHVLAIKNPQALPSILLLLAPEERLSAMIQKDNQGNTVLFNALEVSKAYQFQMSFGNLLMGIDDTHASRSSSPSFLIDILDALQNDDERYQLLEAESFAVGSQDYEDYPERYINSVQHDKYAALASLLAYPDLLAMALSYYTGDQLSTAMVPSLNNTRNLVYSAIKSNKPEALALVLQKLPDVEAREEALISGSGRINAVYYVNSREILDVLKQFISVEKLKQLALESDNSDRFNALMQLGVSKCRSESEKNQKLAVMEGWLELFNNPEEPLELARLKGFNEQSLLHNGAIFEDANYLKLILNWIPESDRLAVLMDQYTVWIVGGYDERFNLSYSSQYDVDFTVGQALITSRDFLNVVLESLTSEQKKLFAAHVLTRGPSCAFASAEDEQYCVAHLKAILRITPNWIMSLQPWPFEPDLSTTMTFEELQNEYETTKERNLCVESWMQYVLKLPFMPIPQMLGLALGLVILLNCSTVGMVTLGAGLTFFSAAGLVMNACEDENSSSDTMSHS